MARFIGTYEQRLDDKGRMVLPAKLRAQLGETGVISKLDGCLGLWTPDDFEETILQFEDAVEDATDPDERRVRLDAMRSFVGDAIEVSPDQQGRVVLNSTLREYAALGSDIVIKGFFRRAEIWDRAAWLEQSSAGDGAIGETVRTLGITGRRAPRAT
ncbi:MAG: division/cell wall cluster transcriptional repressor MraZ [Acidimicrobiales bacterium]